MVTKLKPEMEQEAFINLYQSTRTSLREMVLTEEQKNYFVDNGAIVSDKVAILGLLPIINKHPGCTLRIGDFTVLNSDNMNSIVPIPSPIKFSLGIKAEIIIGEECSLNGSQIVSYQSVTIGDRVHIGPGGLITDTDLHPVEADMRKRQTRGEIYPIEKVQRNKIIIEDDVWIGYGVIILKGVRIGRGAVIGAGSVVTSNVPGRCIVAGNPAAVVKIIA